MSKWEKYSNQTIDVPCEIMFIDPKNRICQGVVKKLPIPGDEVVIAYKTLPVENKITPIEKKFVCYWNWKSRKFWAFNAKTPPNKKLPYYFRIEIPYNNPSEVRYFIHSEVIA
jgi:hypothetical protein